MRTGVIVSGYFNPLHVGHLEYFRLAKALGDELFVIVNNDVQRELKKSQKFQLEKERQSIISSLRIVNHCFISIDNDRSVCNTIKMIFNNFHDEYKFIFANGGDQFNINSPESSICAKYGILMKDGLGKKIQSSSLLLKNK